MNVLIRADASVQSGGGHIARCIALAQAIKARGGETVFATRQDATPGHQMLNSAGIPYFELPSGSDWQGDAEATRQLLHGKDWLVVDHYGLDARWEKTVSRGEANVLVIDDLADRPHDCNVLTDAGRPDSAMGEYADCMTSECTFLLGPRFAMLRGEFGNAPTEKTDRILPKLLVFFGSVDGHGMTAICLDALENAGLFGKVSVHVVLMAANRHSDAIRRRKGIFVYEDISDMAALIADMDIAIGAGGVSLWERCRLGVPSLVIGLNDNQSAGVRLAEGAGAIRSIGISDARQTQYLAEVVREFVTGRDKWPAMASAGQALVDGRGADRVAAHMGSLCLRKARPDDCELYWHWANDPGVRAMAFNSAPIPLEDHRVWFALKLSSNDSLLLIAEQAGSPAGQVRFDLDAEEGGWLVDVSLAPDYRGRKLAVEILQKALASLRRRDRDAVAIARVKNENVASARLFSAAGFRCDEHRSGTLRFVYN